MDAHTKMKANSISNMNVIFFTAAKLLIIRRISLCFQFFNTHSRTFLTISRTFPPLHRQISSDFVLFAPLSSLFRDGILRRIYRHSISLVPPMSRVHIQAIPYQYDVRTLVPRRHIPPFLISPLLSFHARYMVGCHDNIFPGHRS